MLDSPKPDRDRLLEIGREERERGDSTAALAAFEAASALAPEHIGTKLEQVRELRALGRLDEAEAIVNAILSGEPRHFGALIESGLIRRRRGDHAGAAAAFEAAAGVEPKHSGVKLERARDLRLLDRFDEAGALVDAVLAAEPRHIGGFIERGHLCRRRGDRASAAAAFEAAAAIDPKHVGIMLERARDLRALERLDEAEALIDAALAVEPTRIGGLVERGFIRRSRGDHAGAAASFAAASAVDAKQVDIKLEQARDLRALERFDEAVTVLESVLQGQPNNAAALTIMGQVKLRTDRLEEAEDLLLRATRIDSTNAGGFSALGHLNRRRGDRKTALECFRSAARVAPGNVHFIWELSTELIYHRAYDEALRLTENVLASQPSYKDAQAQAVEIRRLMSEAAEPGPTTAVNDSPPQPLPLNKLIERAWDQLSKGQHQEAQGTVAAVLARQPDHLSAHLIAAELALAADQPEDAFRSTQRALDFHPDEVGPYMVGARAAAAMMDEDQALALLQRAQAKFGLRPDLAAAHIHILRQFRNHPAAWQVIRALDNSADAAKHVGFWMERTSFAIAQGEFQIAYGALATANFTALPDRARVEFLRAQFHEAQRQYRHAIVSYEDALALTPSVGAWHDELSRALILNGELERARAHLRASFKLNGAVRLVKGQSLNMSQHHNGQIIDEFLIDGGLADALRKGTRLAPEHRIAPLRELVRDNPDSTAPAMLLLVALRQAGHFGADPSFAHQGAAQAAMAASADPAKPSLIPKRIVQFWHEETPPPDVGKLMSTWRDRHPEYQHIVFDDAGASYFLRTHHPPAVDEAFRRSTHPAQRADIFRLGYLAIEGGIHIDADDRCLDRLDHYIPAAATFVGYQENYATIANNFVAAASQHPVIVRALDLAVEAVNRGDHDIVWLSTGPGLMTRAFCQVLVDPRHADLLASATIIELYVAQRLLGIHAPARYKRSEQHWSNAVFRKAVRPDQNKSDTNVNRARA
jgi:tetratricopeptide (TPR) repeat protein